MKTASVAVKKRRSSAKPPLILVVDDNAESREMYADYLVFSGYRVAEARNGLEGVEKARALRPDLILMDLAMPILDGWRATERLKADPVTRGIIVVALTAHAMVGEAERARGSGCDLFIAKPCLPDHLVEKIRVVLEGRVGAGSTAPPR